MPKKSPIGSKIYKMLAEARTIEPYPVWMTWEGVAGEVYGYSFETRNAQQCVSRLSSVGVVRYTTGRTAGARIWPTDAEQWMLLQVRRVFTGALIAVDSPRYRPPTRDEVLQGFVQGLHDPEVWVNLGEVVALVNQSCKTSFDASEVMWWRLGLERRREQERKVCLRRLGVAMSRLRTERERQEVEARKVWLGPWRVDPERLTECPCCRQEIAAPSVFAQDVRAG
ncbi:hypothetical protein [Streptomyces cavernicola]|uniref:Uncharacterized protein n=1 Tax=Streptomyces cavernicola TaxID=3043613 RepID=A0ABT6S3A9_9ACTN|nr:hypothetical protein [Streptomyces sp. B-S-A6]MDI3402584.1 hypothetical protein [Streptomyces sp. B-S-A6]